MIIKTATSDLDAIRWVCALNDLLCKEFTIENNNGELIQVEILNLDGKELRPEYAWYIARMLQIKIQQNELLYKSYHE